MKQLTENIRNTLNNEQLLSDIKKHADVNPNTAYGDVPMKEAMERFEFLRDSILGAIERGTFDEISHNRRNAIHNVLNSLFQNRGNVQNVIQQIEGLHDNTTISGLFYREIGKKNYEQELKDISSLRRKYNNFINLFEGTKKSLEFIQTKRKQLDQLLKDSENTKNQILEIKSSSDGTLGKIGDNLNTTNQQVEQLKQKEIRIKNKIKEIQEDIEAKKLQITAFFENVDEYKKSIQQLEAKAKEIIGKEEEINDLIDSAEKALQLKSAEGISSAFSAQYASANDAKLASNWLKWAIGLVTIAIGLTVWIVGGWGIENNVDLSSIIGRIVAVAIAISGATFCARQYVKQKNLAEDYAYKATLSKSIIAFTEEIKKRDDKQVAGYLTKVLDEIHKDPLRPRYTKGNSGAGITEKNVNTLERLMKIFNE